MHIVGKVELVKFLDEIEEVCGDIRGRDGEYLDERIRKASKMADDLHLELDEHELPGD